MKITIIFLVGIALLSPVGCEYSSSQGQKQVNKNRSPTPGESAKSPQPPGLATEPQCGQPGVFCPRPADPPPPGSCVDEYGYSTCWGGSAPALCKDGPCPEHRQKPETEEDFKYSLPPRKS